ncbi:MAG: exo-alpha-sialidase, partial [Chitinophagaceae bacterium]
MQTTNITSFLLCLFATVLVSCGVSSRETNAGAEAFSIIDSLPGTCPYLAKDTEGNIVLSWVRKNSDSTAVFCYAVSTDEGKSFGPATVIPSSTNVHPHSENIPKVAFKPSGEIIAVWGAANPNPVNKYSGMVFYSQSFDKGKTWNRARPLVQDTSGFDQRYFDMVLLPDGEVAITWLDNRKQGMQEGSGLYFARTKGKEGFVNERKIQQGCCQCCRTDLFVDTAGGIHVLYRGILKDGIRDMVHTLSSDGGNTFTEPKRISADNWVLNACPHTGPAMAENS